MSDIDTNGREQTCPESIDIEDLIERLHQMNGLRMALLRQFVDDDPRMAMRVYGESLAFMSLIRGLQDYRENGLMGDPPDPERFEAYADMSRAMLRADDRADAVAANVEDESISFQ